MARSILSLVQLVFALQAMAVASNPNCFQLLDQSQTNSVAAATALGNINPITDVPGSTQAVLDAGNALQKANSIVGPIVISLDLASLAPPVDTSLPDLLSALQEAQSAMAGLTGTNAEATQNLLLANANVTEALSLVQQAVDVNCTILSVPHLTNPETMAEPRPTRPAFGSDWDSMILSSDMDTLLRLTVYQSVPVFEGMRGAFALGFGIWDPRFGLERKAVDSIHDMS
ncbi:hypothetical protein C8R45DRAFT_932044 [Mycena sanguinolenta]|nr:hypothetical protein C8R45DRAFT_932044 [Mycena sanguinolenta]